MLGVLSPSSFPTHHISSMEGQSSYENPRQLMSPNIGVNANEASYGHVDDPIQHFLMSAERSEKKPNELPFPQCIHGQKPSRNYVEFLAESSTFLEKASPADMLECIASPVSSTLAVDGVLELQKELSYSNPGKACVSELYDSSQGTNTWNFKPSVYVFSNTNHVASLGFLNPHSKGEPVNKYTSPEYQTYIENLSNHNIWQLRPSVSAAAPDFLPRSKHTSSRQRAATSDRYRRERVAQRIKALQELLPHSAEGNQASVLDDVIDLVKYLQLQMKELSQSRLGGETSITPFVFIEGFGHYIHHEQVMKEPLEEMLGNLLETDPSGVTQLLENRGLHVMPVAFVEALRQAT